MAVGTAPEYGLTGLLERAGVQRSDGTRPGEPWRPSPAGAGVRLAVIAGLIGLVILIPHMIPDVFLRVVARAVVFGIVALSMNQLVGYTGQVSLGHAAFVGGGAFAAGIVLTSAGLPYLAALVVAGLTGAVAALILGGIALRVKGLYLALVTIAYLLFAQNTLFSSRAITGGGAGQDIPRPSYLTSDVWFIYFCYLVLALVWVVDWRLTASKAGRAIRALRDDERVAASWGINVTGYKLLAFVISGTVAGLAGALFGSIEETASSTTFGLTLSLTFLFMAVIGGLGSRPGVVQGGIVFAVLPTLLNQAHTAWGETACTTTWFAGFGQKIGALGPAGFQLSVYGPGPRLLQLLVGAGLLAAGGFVLVRWARGVFDIDFLPSLGRITAWLALVSLGVWLVAGATAGGVCMFSPLTAVFEPLIGAGLLVVTLIFFPGGIAQQQEDLLRWLSFGRFHGPERGDIGAEAEMGGH